MRYAVAVVALVFSFAEISSAQDPSLAAGTRVRVTAPAADLKNHVTIVSEVRGDSVTVGVRGGSRTVAVSDITSLQVSTGQRRRVLVDAMLGFGIGAVTGAALGAASYEECEDWGCFLAPRNRGAAAAEGAVILGAAGVVTGAIVGLFHRTDIWERRTLPVRAAVRPSRTGGVTLALSRTF